MATLESVNGATLVPNLGGGLGMVSQAFGGMMDRKRAEQAQQAQQAQIAQIMGGGGQGGMPGATPGINGNPQMGQEQLMRIAQINPELAQTLQGVMERGDKLEVEQTKTEVDRRMRESAFISQQKSLPEKINAINELARQAQMNGEDVTPYLELANLPEEQMDLRLQGMQIMGADAKALFPEAPKPTAIEQQLQAAGLQPGSPEYQKAIRDNVQGVLSQEALAQKQQIAQSGRSQVNVNTGDSEAAPVVTPPVLLKGLPPDVAAQVNAVYMAAGGGKDGIDAMNKMTENLSEQERRASSSNILANSFPNATEAEMTQLQSAMNAADNTEAGLKRASEIRDEQRRTKKGQQFQNRAVSLLNRIVTNPQLGDVLGSIEGAIDLRLFSDAEAELIADIEEAGNILTADNLDLMTGVLSETDIALLKSLASGGLNRKRSEERFLEDVQQMIDRLSTGSTASGEGEKVGRFTVRVK